MHHAKSQSIIEPQSKDSVYWFVEQMPEFPGGQLALSKYISKNLRYPITDACYEGKVYVKFIIDTVGRIKNPKIARGVDPLLDKEALRLINEMPSWLPGEKDGKKVKVWFIIPVAFHLH